VSTVEPPAGQAVLALHDEALPQVDGDLLHRRGDNALAEDRRNDFRGSGASKL